MLAIAALFTVPADVRAQIASWDSMPKFGTMAMPQGTSFGAGNAKKEEDPGIAISETFVGWLDSAVPRSTVGLRFDSLYNNRQPMRAEYYHPKGGLPNSNGFPLMETRVDYQELTSFAEYSWTPWFSVFVEAPYRWLNPEINENRSGATDMRYGLKLCTWSSDSFIATILVRLYQPSARHESLGTGHWSVEPGLLAAYRLNEMIHFEGEFRYWIPITRDDFAGNVMRYGVGVSYGQKKPGMWVVPVAEGIGWTVMSGQTAIATSANNFEVREARSQTIVNAYLGLRWGYGQNIDFYAGYGRSLTGHSWQRDLYRFEVRYSY
jgi:hypothetical protein